MGLPNIRALEGFLRAARGQSQEEIVRQFLFYVIDEDEIVDDGSVLLNHPRQNKLILFNQSTFKVTSKKELESQTGEQWQKEFSYTQGIAGQCFVENRTGHYSRDRIRGKAETEFFGNSPIHNMVCVPIKTSHGRPFGIVCLHNNDPQKTFSDERIANIEAFVDIFAIALHVPHPEVQLEKNVFIVHGHDLDALDILTNILEEHDIRARVLRDDSKGLVHILTAVEELLRECQAGFILATPDDQGKAVGGRKATPRVRENVMFEAGLLCARFRQIDRVAMLLHKSLKLPSDLEGLARIEFQSMRDAKNEIVAKLIAWDLKGAGVAHSQASSH
jgi:predicted nucleotide-binding protein